MYKSQCEVNLPGGGLTSGTCTIPEHTTQESCEAAGGIFNNPNQTVLDGNTNLLAIQTQLIKKRRVGVLLLQKKPLLCLSLVRFVKPQKRT